MKNLFPKWLSDNSVIIFIAFAMLGFSLALMGKMITAYPSLTFKKIQNANITEIIWGAFVVNLIIERSLEVFISAWRDPGKPLTETQQSLDEKITKIESLITKDNNDTANLVINKSELMKIIHKENTSIEKNSSYFIATKNLSLFGGFSLGLFSSLAGIRIFESFVDLSSTTESQKIVFRTLDILLTALALSGGSKVFHDLVSILTDFAAQTRVKINS